MYIKLFIIVFFYSSSCFLHGYSKELSDSDLIKSFKEINKYLERNGGGDDVQVMINKLDELLKEKSSRMFGGKSLVETLKMLKALSELPAKIDHCALFKPFDLLWKLDTGLGQSGVARIKDPRTPVDKIIEHYAFKEARLCARRGRWPVLNYGLKQVAYDFINKQIAKASQNSEAIDKNMELVEQLVESQESPDGSSADSLRQILSLKLTDQSEESCNEESFDIILRNDFATRGTTHLYYGDGYARYKDLRIVDRIVMSYISKYLRLCRPVIRRKLVSNLMKLDQDTYRKVLGLAALPYLTSLQIDNMVETLYQKELNEDFTIPSMIEYAKKDAEKERYLDMIYLDDIESLDIHKLRLYLKNLLKNDPPSKVDEKNRLKTNVDDPKQLIKLLSDYFFVPCKQYLSTFEKLIEMDGYGFWSDPVYLKSHKDNFVNDLSYHMVRAAYQACEYIDANKQLLLDGFQKYAVKSMANIVYLMRS